MNTVEAILLGILQGLTEFLPVSSSGHLVIAKELFGIETGNLSFEIIVHAATVLSVIVCFWKEILDLISGLFKFKYNDQTRYILMICVSMIPVFIVGMFFKDRVEGIFTSGLLTVGIALMVTSLLLFLSEAVKPKEGPMSYGKAFMMGIAQAIAVIPGLSRSGSTIATGLLCGAKKSEVTQFSFLMVLVPILGEAFLSLLDGEFNPAASNISVLSLCLGFLAAFISGIFACRVMIALVKKARLKWFALYCAIVGIACLCSTFIR
ncbi:MAG: undecaprenyl-diphosphate phosphatase [Bacteroidales bacterium]|nr:undecaprenyl-diphosphate phosphatase [Bacteroidales bacterium]